MMWGRESTDNPEPPRRSEIRIGDAVWVAEKEQYGSGDYTQGIVKQFLTSKEYHPRGIKVRLNDGTVGRVQWFVE